MEKKKMLPLLVVAVMLLLTVSVMAAENNAAGDTAGENILVSGKVSAVVHRANYSMIRMGEGEKELVLYVQDGIVVLDSALNTFKRLADIQTGMTVTALLPKNAPMTMSLPPQTSGAIGVFLNTDTCSVDLSVYNDSLVNAKNTLKLNIAADTPILDAKGTRKNFSEAALKGSECLVIYKASTRSIPAQTTPEMVVIVTPASTMHQESTVKIEPIKANGGTEAIKTDADAQTTANGYVPLRATAEAKGYAVGWNEDKKMATITKNGLTVGLVIDGTAVKYTYNEKAVKAAGRPEKLDLPTMLEQGKTMVQSNLIDALEASEIKIVLSETAPYKLLEDSIADYLNIPEEYRAKTRYCYNYVDLDNDTVQEILVVVTGDYTSGTGGATALHLVPTLTGKLHLAQQFTLINMPIIVSDKMTNGHKELIVLMSGGGTESKYVVLTMQDGKYRDVNNGTTIASLQGVKGVALMSDDAADGIKKNGLYLKGN